jgi:Glutamine amidotransferase domain
LTAQQTWANPPSLVPWSAGDSFEKKDRHKPPMVLLHQHRREDAEICFGKHVRQGIPAKIRRDTEVLLLSSRCRCSCWRILVIWYRLRRPRWIGAGRGTKRNPGRNARVRRVSRHCRLLKAFATMVDLYEQKGADMVFDLRGMFAIAIWDTERRTLFLAFRYVFKVREPRPLSCNPGCG